MVPSVAIWLKPQEQNQRALPRAMQTARVFQEKKKGLYFDISDVASSPAHRSIRWGGCLRMPLWCCHDGPLHRPAPRVWRTPRPQLESSPCAHLVRKALVVFRPARLLSRQSLYLRWQTSGEGCTCRLYGPRRLAGKCLRDMGVRSHILDLLLASCA